MGFKMISRGARVEQLQTGKPIVRPIHNETTYNEIPCLSICKRKVLNNVVIEEQEYIVKGSSLNECYFFLDKMIIKNGGFQ